LAESLRVALSIIRDDAGRRARLAHLIAQFREGARGLPWQLLPSSTAIQPLIVGDSRAAMVVANALRERGFWVPAIRPPTVAQGTARLRVSLSAAHTTDDVAALTSALQAIASAAQRA
jgi:8-amino-7-oxononanoate synthase